MNFNQAKFTASYGLLGQIPASNRMEIAFAGRSNVGKSSLLNKIFNRKSLARVSAVPGKTITVNFYAVDDIYLVDLPGYGYAKVSKSEKRRWSELIEGYFQGDRNLELVVQLIDIRHAPTQDDLQMIQYLIDMEFPFLIALTKSDKLSKRQQDERLKALQTEIPYAEQITMIPCSSETGQGIEQLRRIIEELAADYQPVSPVSKE
ncbi:MAG TPA: ribosome biogenesis GTP-binding protein YihA/YsxC [Firmicutes bacterium]|nr:ribosome biogenesis GTP-binding protein YihA/YsxC [Bacillota bacterium]